MNLSLSAKSLTLKPCLIRFREYIQTPVLTNIQIKSPGFDTYDVHPTHFPDLLAERPIILFGKWRGPVTGTFELTGKSGRGDFLTRLDISGLQPEESNRALRYLVGAYSNCRTL